MNSEIALRKVAKINAEGIIYGYPKCCVEEFSKLIARGESPAMAMYRDDNFKRNSTGFVPCLSCRLMIAEYDLELEDLIHNRKVGDGLCKEHKDEVKIIYDHYFKREFKKLKKYYKKLEQKAIL